MRPTLSFATPFDQAAIVGRRHDGGPQLHDLLLSAARPAGLSTSAVEAER